tara:strand:+ start:803 stop:1186 length:384 start_codon:yes stop_codon:yes gene_type:complete
MGKPRKEEMTKMERFTEIRIDARVAYECMLEDEAYHFVRRIHNKEFTDYGHFLDSVRMFTSEHPISWEPKIILFSTTTPYEKFDAKSIHVLAAEIFFEDFMKMIDELTCYPKKYYNLGDAITHYYCS